MSAEDVSSAREEASFVEYGIEDRPPLGESAVLGVQHYLTMVGATVAGWGDRSDSAYSGQ